MITSAANPRVKWLRGLQKKKERDEAGQFLLEGPHLVEEAIRSGIALRFVAVDVQREGALAPLLERAQAMDIEVVGVSPEVMGGLSDTHTPQGIVAAASLVSKPWAGVGDAGFLAVLDDVQDPGNVGAILRSADAAGCDGVVLSGACADAHNPKTVRAAMGSLFHLPVWVTGDLPGVLSSLSQLGWDTVCGHLEGEDFFAWEPEGPVACVVGNEGAGISLGVKQACSQACRLPMAGKAESLNAAVAAGIMLYHTGRKLKRL